MLPLEFSLRVLPTPESELLDAFDDVDGINSAPEDDRRVFSGRFIYQKFELFVYFFLYIFVNILHF